MKNYFTEEEFTNTFLSLLTLEGINSINRTELLKKLRYYYGLEEYQSLFYSIGLLFGYDKIDLENSLTKAIENDIILIKDNDLLLCSKLEQKLRNKSIECQRAIEKLAKEFALRLKIEQLSKHPLNIYYNSPNDQFNVFKGKYQNQNLYYQLITDGNIKSLEPKSNYKECIVESPMIPNNKICLENITSYRFQLKNAKYAIIKGFTDNQIGQSKVYTLLNEEENLEKIMEYANSEEALLFEEKPMVRRILL